jgi:hypothetical protein
MKTVWSIKKLQMFAVQSIVIEKEDQMHALQQGAGAGLSFEGGLYKSEW